MVEMDLVYEGKLRCEATHGPSGEKLRTDAPKDNQGEGRYFSPTDLVATALGSCVLTTMAIAAQRHGIDLTGTRAHVTKQMQDKPVRKIGQLELTVTFGKLFAEPQRVLLENAARACPVHQSLDPGIHIPIRFVYPKGAAA
jgi:putative redox protein